MKKEVLDFIKKKEPLKLSEILRILKKVIEDEGDIEVQQVAISKNEFSLVKNNRFYIIEEHCEIVDKK